MAYANNKTDLRACIRFQVLSKPGAEAAEKASLSGLKSGCVGDDYYDFVVQSFAQL